MKARFRRHLSFANVTSLMALVFAMGGTGYALTIPKNSVGSQQLKKGGVTNSDIGSSAVTSTKVKNRSLFARDFALGQLPAGTPGANGATGATGPAGPTGPQGLTGIVGGAITVQREDLNVADNLASGFQVTCPAGTKIVGGGSSLDQTSVADIHLTVSRPFRTTPGVDGTLPADGETFDAWRVVYFNPAGGTPATPAHVFAICAEV